MNLMHLYPDDESALGRIVELESVACVIVRVIRTGNVMRHLQVGGDGPNLADSPVERDDSRSLIVGVKAPETLSGFVRCLCIIHASSKSRSNPGVVFIYASARLSSLSGMFVPVRTNQ